MRTEIFLLIICSVMWLCHCQTGLEPLLKITRLFMGELTKPRTFEVGYQISLKNDRVQREYKNESFFCDINGPGRRSDSVPTSVHKLTPGDIDIVGAIGDSLTAANGAFAIDSLQTTLEGRGVAWSIGGKDNWRRFVTLPNLLKEYNPKLYGYSTAPNSLGFQKISKFNVAEPGAISGHTIRQAKNLVKRMRSDSRVDIKRHWKLVTIMIGSNDFCLDVCYHKDQKKLVEQAQRDLIRVLRILRENLPRTLVNVVLPVDVSIIFRFQGTSKQCQGFHWLECPCLTSLSHVNSVGQTLQTIKGWNIMTKEVVDMDEFHNRNDFEVNLISFTAGPDLNKPDGRTDFSYLSQDCFHLSQKGHMFIASQLWNSMLLSENERPSYATIRNQKINCPTYEHPYFRTRKN